MKIIADLDAYETEALFDLINDAIVDNTSIATLNYITGEITKSELKWSEGHARFLEGIKKKLLAEHTKATKHLRPKRLDK